MTVRVSLLGSYGQGPGVRCKHLVAGVRVNAHGWTEKSTRREPKEEQRRLRSVSRGGGVMTQA
eukprot:620463-Pyramimonas_sp.AAC.1